jgi:hypothetical protein
VKSHHPESAVRTEFHSWRCMASKSEFLVGRRRAIPQFVAVRNGTCDSYLSCLAKIKSACEINNIQRHRVTCYMDENRLVRSFGEGQPSSNLVSQPELIKALSRPHLFLCANLELPKSMTRMGGVRSWGAWPSARTT